MLAGLCCLHRVHHQAPAAEQGAIEAPAEREEDVAGMRATPEEVAHWVLRHAVEDDQSAAAFMATAEAMHTQLRTGLSVFVGASGFDAIWARAVSQGARSAPEGAAEDALVLRAPGWPDALSGLRADEMRSVVAAVFTSFIGLLFTFVGTELGFRLLSQVWPELPLDTPGTPTGDGTA